MNRLLLISGVLVASYGLAHAEDIAMGKVSTNAVEVSGAAAAPEEAPVEVNNKFCPISSEETGKMGPAEKVTYNGKVYNLCCSMCLKDFNKDPEAAIAKIEAQMEKEKSN